MKTTLTTAILILFTQFCLAQPNTDLPEDFWIELEKPTGGMIFSLAVKSITEIYAGMGNGVYLSNDDSNSWTLTGLEGITSYSLHIHQNGNVFAGTGGFNAIYRLKNIEEGWIPVFACGKNIISLASNSNNDVFAGSGGDYGLQRSTNNGADWVQLITLSGTEQTNAILLQEDNQVFIGTTDFMGGGGVYRSTDNGDTWEHTGLKDIFVSSLAVSSSGTLFAGSSGGDVYRSEDNGSTWELVAVFGPVTSIAIDPNDLIYIGCGNGVFRSLDDGESWELLVTGMGDYTSVKGLSISPDGYLYAYETKLFRSANPVFITSTMPNSDIGFVKIFPNPFTDIVHFEMPGYQFSNDPLSVKVFDPLGREIYRKSLNQLQDDGTIILTTLPPGIYYISIELNGKIYSKPIVKVSK